MPDQTQDEIRLVQEINKAREYERKKVKKEIEEEIQKENEDYLRALQKQMLLNILSAKGIIYTHYKNKQITKDIKNVKQIRNMDTDGTI